MTQTSKKRIGIAAVTYKENFGSALQTYATQFLLEKLGYDAKIFEIKGIHRSIHIKKVIYYVGRLFDPTELKYLLANLKSRTRKTISVSSDQYAKDMKIRKKVYDDFYSKWNNMLPIAYSWKELSEQASQMDAVIVGSDQLWRPSNIVGGFFTLEFVPEKIKKISFSTSFGVPELPKRLYARTRKFLYRFNYISVRENTGASIVKELSGKTATVVCDPTMMLTAEQWMHIQSEEPFADGQYILCYFMGDNPEHRSFAKRLRDKTGLKIIGLLHGATYIADDENFADEKPYDVGPSEFINLIRNAEYICTDSFHGCVFSILNKKSFFAFRRWPDNSKFSANDRLYTLLKFTGLESRLLDGNEDVESNIFHTIDYESVLRKVEERRNETLHFLKNALEQ